MVGKLKRVAGKLKRVVGKLKIVTGKLKGMPANSKNRRKTQPHSMENSKTFKGTQWNCMMFIKILNHIKGRYKKRQGTRVKNSLDILSDEHTKAPKQPTWRALTLLLEIEMRE